MSKPSSGLPSIATTPVPSSPPASESFFSEIDGTAPSILETSYGDITWDPPADASALNIVSWKLDVDAHVEDGVNKRGFNAISTVLNHPTKKANPLRSSRKPLPPLAQPPPSVPRPYPSTHYDSYLKSITPLYESFMQAQSSSSSSFKPPTLSDEDIHSASLSKGDLPSLQAIPSIFFDTDFDLANPATWSEVVDSQLSSASRSKDRESAAQDALSTHLDNLESHLVHEITLRSSSFFSALSNLQDLNSESTSCLSRISDLQQSLREVGSKQARRGLEIIDAQSRLQALRVTEGGIKRLSELDETLRISKSLADGGDWAGALGCVEDVVRWWERYGSTENASTGEAGTSQHSSSTNLPLATLPALSSLPLTITSLTSGIATQLESVLESMILSVLTHDEENISVDREHQFKASVEPILSGLVRCGRADAVEGVWRTAVTTIIRDGSRKFLPVSQGDEEAEGDGKPKESQSLAQALQSMDHSQFLLLSKQMYGAILSRLQLVHQMGEDIAAVLTDRGSLPVLSISPYGTNPPSVPSKGSETSQFDPGDVMTSACELANTRASKILAVRAEQNAVLTIEEFVEIFSENWSFVLATETLAKRMIVSLRGVTASQARAFLIKYHAVRLTTSAKLVEEELWVQFDVPSSTQHTVNLIVESAVSDPAECFIPPRRTEDPATNGHTTNNDTQTTKVVRVEDKSFFVVKATSESLMLLGDYLRVVINLELVVTDVMTRVIEFLKSFNSRTCQVVLGAGAMRSAGLRNITAKHLALASQSLSVVVALIPYIREFIRRHMSPKQAVVLTEFDKVKRDYQEHQNEIHAKLIDIMDDRLAVHCSALKAIDWEATPDTDGPRAYAEMLVKETATLHKVLSKYLAQQTVEIVLSQVLAASVKRLGEEYAKVEFKSEDAKKRMLQDVTFIAQRLTPLSEGGGIVGSLETLVKDKATPRKLVSETVRGLLRRNGSSTMEPAKTPEDSEIVDKGEDSESEDVDGDGAVVADKSSSPAATGTQVNNDKEAVEEVTLDEVPVATDLEQSPPTEAPDVSTVDINESDQLPDLPSKDEEAGPPIPDKEDTPGDH